MGKPELARGSCSAARANKFAHATRAAWRVLTHADLVAIVLRFEGAINADADVFRLVRPELGQLRTELAEM